MATFDDLDAPQFSTFDDADLDEVETYFETDHEIPNNNQKRTIVASEKSMEDHFYSPLSSDSQSNTHIPPSTGKFLHLRNRKIRRSMSSGHIPTSSDTHEIKKGKCSTDKSQKFEYGKLQKSSSQSKSKWCSTENLNRLAAPKTYHSSTGNLAKSSEYVSVAEAVRKFQELTPTRYHSRNKKHSEFQNGISAKLKPTIPHSPKLLTKSRAKPNIPIMSFKDREILQFEEAQKFKIKANPINRKIFQQPLKAIHVDKKPSTIPQPFKLTKVNQKKPEPSPQKEYQFHAKPVPKSVLGAPKLPDKQPPQVTNPVTPTFIKRLPKASPVKKDSEKKPITILEKTKPEPFSFEKRDMKLLQKKEEFIKKVVEEEKKAREFHARPIPKPVASLINKQKQKSLNATSLSQEPEVAQNIEEPFKARPPLVLYQKPFEPKRLEHPLTEIQPFQLHSEHRAKEREIFEQKKREQEERAAEILRREEEERIRREEEEAKKFRKETDFKAQPVRNFKELIIKPSGKVTEPISPVFLSGRRSNKENCQQNN